MKAGIFVCGEGLGHTTRCLALGERLISQGHKIFFCAYGYSKKHLEESGFSVHSIPFELQIIGDEGSVSMRRSIFRTVRKHDPFGFPKLMNIIRGEKPDVVVSDSYLMGAISAKIAKKPLVMILNQTNMYNLFKGRGADVETVGKAVHAFSKKVFRMADRIIVPDFPPPYAVCEKNIDFETELIDKVEFIGPMVRKKPEDVKALHFDRPHILSMVGGFGYREKIFHNVIEAAKSMSDYDFTLASGPSVNLDHVKSILPKNIQIVKHINDVFPYLKGSEAVIAPGGHSTIMECASFGKPILCFPDMFHTEQENNAKKAEELGIGRCLSYFNPPFMIEEFIRESKTFEKNCAKLMEYARKMDGAGRASDIVEDMA
jgi:uncharacterized protein (TIGR00661 family)